MSLFKKLLVAAALVAVPATAWAAVHAHDSCGCTLGGKCSCGAHCHCK